MVSGDWPELESLVIATGVRMLRVNETAASIAAIVRTLSEAASALPEYPTAGDISTFGERSAAQVPPLEAAATVLETEMAAIAPGHGRIVEIVTGDHDAVGVAEEYLGGAVSLGAAAGRAAEEFGAFSRTLEQLGRAYPRVKGATDDVASTTRRAVVALEPAKAWGHRSTEILSDWD